MSNPKEGNILSYKILLDNKGNLITEFSGLPLEKVHTVFKGHDVKVIKKLIQEGSVHLESLHDRLQKEIQAIST
jgi:hypothetical protein|tara:strand:- start:216 stop:437 length:222 start_codon:yes stop_codon:yes gene_type:complete